MSLIEWIFTINIMSLCIMLGPPLLTANKEFMEKLRAEVRVETTIKKAERAVNVIYAMPIRLMNDPDSVYHKILYCRQWARHLEAIPINQMTARQVMLRDKLALKLWAREDQFSARFLELEDINRSETRKAA